MLSKYLIIMNIFIVVINTILVVTEMFQLQTSNKGPIILIIIIRRRRRIIGLSGVQFRE